MLSSFVLCLLYLLRSLFATILATQHVSQAQQNRLCCLFWRMCRCFYHIRTILFYLLHSAFTRGCNRPCLNYGLPPKREFTRRCFLNSARKMIAVSAFWWSRSRESNLEPGFTKPLFYRWTTSANSRQQESNLHSLITNQLSCPWKMAAYRREVGDLNPGPTG